MNVGPEGADFVPFFYNYGVNTIILRNRLRVDGHEVQKDEVNDALQSIRLVRAYAKDWNIDPNKIVAVRLSLTAFLPTSELPAVNVVAPWTQAMTEVGSGVIPDIELQLHPTTYVAC